MISSIKSHAHSTAQFVDRGLGFVEGEMKKSVIANTTVHVAAYAAAYFLCAAATASTGGIALYGAVTVSCLFVACRKKAECRTPLESRIGWLGNVLLFGAAMNAIPTLWKAGQANQATFEAMAQNEMTQKGVSSIYPFLLSPAARQMSALAQLQTGSACWIAFISLLMPFLSMDLTSGEN